MICGGMIQMEDRFVTGMIHRIFTRKLADYRRRLNINSGGDAKSRIFGSKKG
jgi:hypothetical protein